MALEGGDHLESVRWQNNQTGQSEEYKIRHVFVMTGANPNTSWLDGCIALDGKGFIMTGPGLSEDNLSVSRWPLARQPYLLETSLPGVFAVGDARVSLSAVVTSIKGSVSPLISGLLNQANPGLDGFTFPNSLILGLPPGPSVIEYQ